MTLAESPALGVKAEGSIGRLEYKDCISYPRPKLQYNSTSAQINVLEGEGVLVIQTSGKDEKGRVSPDVVENFQCIRMGETSRKSFTVPAGSWHLLYDNIDDKPLVTEIVNNSAESPADQLEAYVPYPAYEVVRQNGALALVPTLRVREIKSVDRGGIAYAQQDTRDKNLLPGWRGKV